MWGWWRRKSWRHWTKRGNIFSLPWCKLCITNTEDGIMQCWLTNQGKQMIISDSLCRCAKQCTHLDCRSAPIFTDTTMEFSYRLWVTVTVVRKTDYHKWNVHGIIRNLLLALPSQPQRAEKKVQKQASSVLFCYNRGREEYKTWAQNDRADWKPPAMETPGRPWE